MTQPTKETRFLHVTEMGLGAWQWGDRILWGYGHGYSEADVCAALEVSLAQGIRFVDSAEIYGNGFSERLLGQCLKDSGQPVLVATKFFPWPWRLTKGSIHSALKGSLKRLNLDHVDLYQIHWPTPLLSPETMMEGMVACVKEGLTRTVGVSNFGQTRMLRVYSALAQHNIPLASNQVHYSLIDREVEKNGTLARCQELGVRLIAYSPLEKGLLTGKYSQENPPPGPRRGQYADRLPKIPPLLKLMTEIGQDHGGKTNSQVALNWLICKGALPIPGAKNAAQALDNSGALGWRLSERQVARLDEASELITK
jgi:aryl-alcohol dehydrogenase-like predicted oxidoreductase